MLCTIRDSDADLNAMVAGLRDHSYSALILDEPVLEYLTGQNEDCDLFLVGETFNAFSLALAFPSAFDDQIAYQFSRSIVKIQVMEEKTSLFSSAMYRRCTQQVCLEPKCACRTFANDRARTLRVQRCNRTDSAAVGCRPIKVLWICWKASTSRLAAHPNALRLLQEASTPAAT